ncbi:transcription factor NIGTH1-like [Miscanthus floridulus]|uniref:transcription factor NIGTH1-like n=1 Tax=Miscanthus floridulus TaxID=154761 RepID=UPI00345A6CD9
MASSPSDLTLDYKPNGNGAAYAVTIPKPPQEPLVDGHHHHHHHLTTAEQATQKLREFLACLEEERLKIDAFKRELPLCMQLLNHAMESYRQQLEAYQMGSLQGAPARPLVLEEFMPLNNIRIDADAADKMGNPPSEKASWMESAQLWNGPAAAADVAAKGPQTPKESSEHPLPIDTLCAHDAAAGQRNGGAFLPFAKDKTTSAAEGAALPELALAPADKDAADADRKPYLDAGSNNGVLGARRDVVQNGVKSAPNAPEGQQAAPPPQTHRKARRCWSPELHRRFVNALQILGGAQVATPKQIRELMKVDGLTNDEVKSHLQKYRLHTRRPMPAPPAPATAAPQLVVLGGIWVPPEYATQAAGQAIYSAHPATQPHYTAAVAAAQEYYPSPAAVHHHLQHHPAAAAAMVHRAAAAAPPQQQAAYKAEAAMAGSPPGSEGRGSAGGGSVGGGGGGRERSESIEEEGEGEEREEEEEDDDDDMAAAKAAAEEAAAGAGVVAKY